MISITTKYLSATSNRGARIKAFRADHDKGETTVTVPYDYALDANGNHLAAARSLAAKLGWDGTWYGGNGAPGFCHYVMISGRDSFTI